MIIQYYSCIFLFCLSNMLEYSNNFHYRSRITVGIKSKPLNHPQPINYRENLQGNPKHWHNPSLHPKSTTQEAGFFASVAAAFVAVLFPLFETSECLS